jgi:hypothetical protein
MKASRFQAHGLTIESDYPLAMEASVGDAVVDVVVRRGSAEPVPAEDPPGAEPLALVDAPDGHVFYSFTRTSTEVLLRYPGICFIRGDNSLSQMTVHAAPGVDEGLISVLVAGAVISLHLTLRGDIVLHASAVEVDGGAVAFVGMAGMGKSTVATLFGRAGYTHFSDDVLRVTHHSASTPVAHRGGIGSRLRAKANSLTEGLPVNRTADGRSSVQLPVSPHFELPLRACVIPQPSRAAQRVAIRRLSPAEGLIMLLRFPRLVGWSDAGSLARQFVQLGNLAEVVPVVTAELPWGPPFDPTTAEQLLAALDL